MLGRLAFHGLGAGLSAAWWVGSTAHRAFSLLPAYRGGVALVADTILGPAEDFEYVSTTAPSSSPPTY